MVIPSPSPLSHSPVAALIVAAGRGTRLGGDVPKQYRALGSMPVLAHTLAAFAKVRSMSHIHTVIHPDDETSYQTSLDAALRNPNKLEYPHFSVANGGKTRQESVLAGLEALAQGGFPDNGIVLVHDAARPFISETVILRAILAAMQHGAAIPVLPMADTLAQLDAAGHLADNPDRAKVFRVQTPQAFQFGLLLTAHRKAAMEGRFDFTDDAGVVKAAGHAVGHFEGDEALFKITTADDLARANAILNPAPASAPAPALPRMGIGYDVHAFTDGDYVTLGGVQIPHSRALLGHSDADPVLHALTDALLGTIGDGDIGVHFPPSDAQWRGAASHVFLADAARRVREAGGIIQHVDTMILCEAPKIGAHRTAMKAAIGVVLDLPAEAIGIKATTMEGLGFIGRREGIAAMAVACVSFRSKRG